MQPIRHLKETPLLSSRTLQPETDRVRILTFFYCVCMVPVGICASDGPAQLKQFDRVAVSAIDSTLTPNAQAKKSFELGRLHFEKAEWRLAENAFTESLKAESGFSADILFYLARTEVALRKFDEANETLDKLEQREGRSVRVLCTRALSQFAAGDVPVAIETATAAINKQPDHSYALYIRGLAYLANRDPASALADFSRAECGAESDFGISGVTLALNRAKALEALGRTRESTMAVLEARDMEPESLEALAAYWHCQRRDGYLPEALQTAKLALEFHPKEERAIQIAAISYAENEEFAAALRHAKTWAAIAPSSPAAQRLLCQSYFACDETASALKILADMLAKEPNDTWARSEKALILAMSSKTKEQRQEAQQLTDALPDSGDMAAWCWLVKAIAWLADDPQKAAQCLSQADTSNMSPRHRHYLRQVRTRLKLAKAKNAAGGV